MIRVQQDGRTVRFTGKDHKLMLKDAKKLGLSPQTWFTGMMWECLMRCARRGYFLNARKEGLESKQVLSRGRKKDLAMVPHKKGVSK